MNGFSILVLYTPARFAKIIFMLIGYDCSFYNYFKMNEQQEKQDECQKMSFKLGTIKIYNNFNTIFNIIDRKIFIIYAFTLHSIRNYNDQATLQNCQQILSQLNQVIDKIILRQLFSSFMRIKLAVSNKNDKEIQEKALNYKRRSQSLIYFGFQSNIKKRTFHKSPPSATLKNKFKLQECEIDRDLKKMQKKVNTLQATFSSVLALHRQ